MGNFRHKSKQTKNRWFDDKCHTDKKNFNRLRNKYNKEKSVENRNDFIKARTKYNKTKIRAFYMRRKKEGNKIQNMAVSNLITFWQTLKKAIPKENNVSSSLSTEEFYNYFKNMFGQFSISDFNSDRDSFTNQSYSTINVEPCVFK